MRQIIFFILLAFPFVFLSCSSDDEEQEPLPPYEYETIVGHTYIRCEVGSPFRYHIHTFKDEGTIDIEVRLKSSDGELERKGKGTYEYNHPVLKLSGEISCSNCNSNFEATVSEDRRDFKIVTWTDERWYYDVFDYYYSEIKHPFPR